MRKETDVSLEESELINSVKLGESGKHGEENYYQGESTRNLSPIVHCDDVHHRLRRFQFLRENKKSFSRVNSPSCSPGIMTHVLISIRRTSDAETILSLGIETIMRGCKRAR